MIERACEETQAALTIPPRDPVAHARVSLHLGRCERCQSVARDLRELRDDVLAVNAELDDVRRARMQARMAAALDDVATQAGGAPNRRTWRAPIVVFSMAAAACLALVATIALSRKPLERTAAQGNWGEVTREAAVLRATDRPVDDVPSATLSAGPGERRRAVLAGRARLTLVGPGRLVVDAVTASRIDLRIDGGLLIGDYDRKQGGGLVIHSPGARSEIVGTVFSVDARAGKTRVTVARGRVKVRPRDGAERSLGAGETWNAGAPVVESMSEQTKELFREHEAHHAPGGEAVAPASPAPAQVGAGSAPVPAAAELGRANAPGTSPSTQQAVRAPAPAAAAREGDRAAPARPAPVPSRRLALRSPERPVERHATSRTVAPSPEVVPELVPPRQPVQAPPPAANAPVIQKPPVARPPAVTVAPAAAPPERPAATAPVVTAESLYADAERALARGDARAARATLERLQREHGADPLADAAGYELALLALRHRDHADARRALDRVIAQGREPALREAVRHLRCRVDLEARRPREALACLEQLRRDLPGGSRDAEALAVMVGIAVELRDCARARTLAQEHALKHRSAPSVAEVSKRVKACPP